MWKLLNLVVTILLLIFWLLSFSNFANAQSDMSHDIPTFYLKLGAGLTTYKSEAVQSNDTSFTMGYALGCYGGKDKSIGMAIQSDSNTTAFQYAESEEKSKVNSSFQSTLLKYRWGPLHFGVLFDQSSLIIELRDVDYLDAVGSGYGANFGLYIPIGRHKSEVFIDISQVSTSIVKETIQDTDTVAISLGNRMDIQLGGVIKLTKELLDLHIGYRQRTFNLQVGGESFQEIQTMPWIGLGTNLFF